MIDNKKTILYSQSFVQKMNSTNYEVFMLLGFHAAKISNEVLYQFTDALYNAGLFIHNGYDFDNLMKSRRDKDAENIYDKDGVMISQQVQQQVRDNIIGWLSALEEFKKDSNKFSGKPQMPHTFHDAPITFAITPNGFNFDNESQTLYWYSGQLKNKRPMKRVLWWRKLLEPIKLDHHIKIDSIKQVKVVIRVGQVKVKVMYEVEDTDFIEDNGRYLSIDPGQDILAAIASNFKMEPILIDGSPMKGVNNKIIDRIHFLEREMKKKNGNQKSSKRIKKLYANRDNQLTNLCHKTSNFIVDLAVKHNVSKIYIGTGNGSKTGAKYGDKYHKNFRLLPHGQLNQQITYKAKKFGIEVITVDEYFTSQTSFLNDEKPRYTCSDKFRKENHLKNSKRRQGRLFTNDDGRIINADVNGALQILVRARPNAEFEEGMKDLVLRPHKVKITQ